MLAPMAGVSDPAMRQLCIEQGAQLTFTEMVSAKGLSYANERTSRLLDRAPNERMVGVQLFGHEPDTMAEQARQIASELGSALAVIDLNMGCPARKIVSKGDGASLMERPEEARAIIEAAVAAVDVPVTVKFRRGYGNGDETASRFACMVEEAGASAVTVHGRFAQQMYHGSSCPEAIARVKAAVGIPVVGNGDICDGASALRLIESTGCDAVMIGRAAQGDPWVFADVRAALEGAAPASPPTPYERIEMARRHAHLLHGRDPRSVVRMRKHAGWYCKGLPGASAARGALNACTTVEDFDEVFNRLEEYMGFDHA
jgi:tRNA-dihydrouridine synthase B